jgi:hypothetical protein
VRTVPIFTLTAVRIHPSGTGRADRFRLTAMTEIWNFWTRIGLEVGPLQSSGMAAFNSPIGAGETIAIAVQTVPDSLRELAFGAIAVDVPVAVDVLTHELSSVSGQALPLIARAPSLTYRVRVLRRRQRLEHPVWAGPACLRALGRQ